MPKCKHGCGKNGTHQLKSGDWVCRKGLKCPVIRKKISKSVVFDISKLRKKHPILFKHEDFLEVSLKHKQGYAPFKVHCRNDSCMYSKENNGWFRPELKCVFARAQALETKTRGHCYFWCSETCKNESPKYNHIGVSVAQKDIFVKIRKMFPFLHPILEYYIEPYHIDIAIPEIKLAIEYDGLIWHSKEKVIEYDKNRQEHLEKLGWIFLRYSDKNDHPSSKDLFFDINFILK